MRYLPKFFAILTTLLLAINLANAQNGVISVESQLSVEETVAKLQIVLKETGSKIFAVVNHSAGAASVGAELRPMQVVIFGNPKAGSRLMKCAQTVGLDLPQKMLIWQDESGKVWLSYNDTAYLKERHGMKGCRAVLKKITGGLSKLAKSATTAN